MCPRLMLALKTGWMMFGCGVFIVGWIGDVEIEDAANGRRKSDQGDYWGREEL